MTVCQCEAVGSGDIERAIAAGASTVDEVTDGCRAGGGCGRCHRLIEDMLDRCLPAAVAA